MLTMDFSTVYINMGYLLTETLKPPFSIKKKTKCSHNACPARGQHARLRLIGLESHFITENVSAGSCPACLHPGILCPSCSSVTITIMTVTKRVLAGSDSVPTWLGSLPSPRHGGLSSEVKRDRFGHRVVWQLPQAPNHLALVYRVVSLSNFTSRVQKKSK